MKFNRASLEMERTKYEILKLRYEIEGLKKTHELPELHFPDELEKRMEGIVAEPAQRLRESEAIKTQQILKQVQNISERERFVVKRGLAIMIDYFVLVLLLFLLAVMVGFFYIPEAILGAIISLVMPLYFPLLWQLRGATVGKMMVGLKIVKQDGSQLTLKEVAIRFIVLGSLNIFAFLWMFRDKNKLALHDRLAKTVMVNVRIERKEI